MPESIVKEVWGAQKASVDLHNLRYSHSCEQLIWVFGGGSMRISRGRE